MAALTMDVGDLLRIGSRRARQEEEMAAEQGVGAGEVPRFMLPAVEDVRLALAYYSSF